MKLKWLSAVAAVVLACSLAACDDLPTGQAVQSNSGVTQKSVQVATGSDGLTAEQRNVRDRLVEDNKPGAIKHLYVISAYSGQVLMYSTVRGKVTSSGKRLTPTSVAAGCANQEGCWGIQASIAGDTHRTPEVLQDDGTYGQSNEYVYWWDVQGRYHQLYTAGGFLVTISDQPLPVKSITINLEQQPAN